MQIGNDYRNGGLAKAYCCLEGARERRHHDQIDRNFRSRLSRGSDLVNADLG